MKVKVLEIPKGATTTWTLKNGSTVTGICSLKRVFLNEDETINTRLIGDDCLIDLMNGKFEAIDTLFLLKVIIHTEEEVNRVIPK